MHGHLLGGAFAVAHHMDGEFEQHVAQRLAEDFRPRIVEALDRFNISLAGGEGQQGVGGRGVAVDSDGIEAGLVVPGQQRLQDRGGDGHVGDDEGQHGRHIGRDHPRTLGDAVDPDLDAIDLKHGARELGEGIGGHDRLGRFDPGQRIHAGRGLVEHAVEFGGVDQLTDNAGLGNEHF